MSLLIKNCILRNREGLWDVYCEDKTINKIGQNPDLDADTTIDLEAKLLVPAMIDPHIHLDKVNILDSVRKNVTGTLTEAIENIWDLLPSGKCGYVTGRKCNSSCCADESSS